MSGPERCGGTPDEPGVIQRRGDFAIHSCPGCGDCDPQPDPVEGRISTSDPQFKVDLAEASRLVRANDTEGLAAFLSRNVEERAKEAVDAIRATRDPVAPEELWFWRTSDSLGWVRADHNPGPSSRPDFEVVAVVPASAIESLKAERDRWRAACEGVERGSWSKALDLLRTELFEPTEARAEAAESRLREVEAGVKKALDVPDNSYEPSPNERSDITYVAPRHVGLVLRDTREILRGLLPSQEGECDHDWVDLHNKVVESSGYPWLCLKCGRIRQSEAQGDE